jgi:hypothetical protein
MILVKGYPLLHSFVPVLERVWLRVVDGRAVNVIATRLVCVLRKPGAADKTVWVLNGDNRSGTAPVGTTAKSWDSRSLLTTNASRRAKEGRENCNLPVAKKCPRLAPMEVNWLHGKHRRVETDAGF